MTTLETNLTARLATSIFGGWELYVVTDGPSKGWPEHSFGTDDRIPSSAERAQALAVLGYEITGSAGWEWTELNESALTGVHLIASIQVRPAAKGGNR